MTKFRKLRFSNPPNGAHKEKRKNKDPEKGKAKYRLKSKESAQKPEAAEVKRNGDFPTFQENLLQDTAIRIRLYRSVLKCMFTAGAD